MLSIFFIGIALSMDAFSIALSIGTNNLSKKSIGLTITLVGLMHFIMPQLGLMLGNQVYNFININCVKNNSIKSIEDIHEEILKKITNH